MEPRDSEEDDMADKNQGGTQDQLEAHSLPGTNQAGKGPGADEKNVEENRSGTDPGEAVKVVGRDIEEVDREDKDGKTTE